MRGRPFNPNNLTNAASCALLLLTFFLCLFANCSETLAFTADRDAPDTSAYARANNAKRFAEQEGTRRLGLMADYAKGQIPHLAPGLPSFIRNPGGWVSRGLGGSSPMDMFDEDTGSFLQPVQSAFTEPSVNAPQAMWISPSYHHRGFLPMNDAMIMGVHMRQSFSDLFAGHGVQLDLHPFYGQSWHSTDYYWGTEIAFDLHNKDAAHPWGKIALRFTNGDTDLTDRGHGFDMHGQLNFDEHLSLNTGIRENGRSEAGNYVMMRWKLVGD